MIRIARTETSKVVKTDASCQSLDRPRTIDILGAGFAPQTRWHEEYVKVSPDAKCRDQKINAKCFWTFSRTLQVMDVRAKNR